MQEGIAAIADITAAMAAIVAAIAVILASRMLLRANELFALSQRALDLRSASLDATQELIKTISAELTKSPRSNLDRTSVSPSSSKSL